MQVNNEAVDDSGTQTAIDAGIRLPLEHRNDPRRIHNAATAGLGNAGQT